MRHNASWHSQRLRGLARTTRGKRRWGEASQESYWAAEGANIGDLAMKTGLTNIGHWPICALQPKSTLVSLGQDGASDLRAQCLSGALRTAQAYNFVQQCIVRQMNRKQQCTTTNRQCET